jgi:RNA polymerase sigma-70 factor (ECF subfamily)
MSEGMKNLIQQAQAGDGRACEELFRLFVQSVFATAHRLSGNVADAEDITQETFVRAFRGIGGFQHRSGFRTWLYRILFHVAQDFSQKRAKEPSGTSVQLDEVDDALATEAEGGPAERAGAEEERRLLRRAVGELPERERVALTLVYLDGMSGSEAAEIMEAREGTMYWWLHEARRRLARRLSARGEFGQGSAGKG